jgi:hypothetical protein
MALAGWKKGVPVDNMVIIEGMVEISFEDINEFAKTMESAHSKFTSLMYADHTRPSKSSHTGMKFEPGRHEKALTLAELEVVD